MKTIRTDSSSSMSVFRVRVDFGIHKKKGQKQYPSPVNVIIWAMNILGKQGQGVPIYKIRSLIKKHFVLPCRRNKINKKINTTVMFAVYFGVLRFENNLFYLNPMPPTGIIICDRETS